MSPAISGLGIAVPGTRVTNEDLTAQMNTSDAWIVARTGIRERRVAAPGETTATLATAAGAAAIRDAGLVSSDVDVLVVATSTPEQPLPATSAFVADALGLRSSAGAFDLGAACSGFVYALVVAFSLITRRVGRHVLVVGSETLTRIVDPCERSTAVLFGDGAGAVVVSGDGFADHDDRLLSCDLGCDGSLASLLEIPAGGSRRPVSAQTVADGGHFLAMDGREVFRRAVRVVVDSARATLERAERTVGDVDLFVPHQANARIIDAVLDRLGLAPERTVVNLDRYGNTSAASIPLALAEARDSGRLQAGDLVLLSGFGAGMTWGSALVRW
ncbi:MAG: beta-ketoacyl-ACP synthase 3 [Acidimicrobiales bacterium]